MDALMKAARTQEVTKRRFAGNPPMALTKIAATLADLGYRLDRTMDCVGPSRYITGPDVGCVYPAITTGVEEIDTGLSAYHYTARRDANFRALQALRASGELYAVLPRGLLEP